MKAKFTPSSATFTQDDLQVTFSKRTDDRVIGIDEKNESILLKSPQAAQDVLRELNSWGFSELKIYQNAVMTIRKTKFSVRNQRKTDWIVEENAHGRFDVRRGDEYAAWNERNRDKAEEFAHALNTGKSKKRQPRESARSNDNITQERMILMIDQLAKKHPTGAVRLANLREWLSDYPREKLDELLLKARSEGQIILYQDDDNLTANKPRNKNAALHYRDSKYDLIYLSR